VQIQNISLPCSGVSHVLLTKSIDNAAVWEDCVLEKKARRMDGHADNQMGHNV
jgi:hypothetical protein